MLFAVAENVATSTLMKGLIFFDDIMSMAFTPLTVATQIYYSTKDIRATQLE